MASGDLGLSNSLLPGGIKPLTEQMLSYYWWGSVYSPEGNFIGIVEDVKWVSKLHFYTHISLGPMSQSLKNNHMYFTM